MVTVLCRATMAYFNSDKKWPLSCLSELHWLWRYGFKPSSYARRNYKRVLDRIRHYESGRKLKVLFVTGTPSKFKAQSLYDLMVDDLRFDPYVCQTICDTEYGLPVGQKHAHLDRCREYYQQRGMRYVEAFSREKNSPIDLNDFCADIVIYFQPWNVYECQMPSHVSKSALTFQIPYFVANYGDVDADVHTPFHLPLFGIFVLNEFWASLYRRSTSRLWSCANYVSVGHTALDCYSGCSLDSMSGEYVIYAPHWSFSHPGNENFENYSTFLTTGKPMLEYARCHPEVKWVFKPHPTLRLVLEKSGAWSRSEVDEYWHEWERIGVLCYDGDYAKLFVKSRALITDCGSFLSEYVCTGNPIIHLISPDCKLKPLPPSARVYDTYYKVHSLDELNAALMGVVEQGVDERRNERIEAARNAGLIGNCAAAQIVRYLKELLP